MAICRRGAFVLHAQLTFSFHVQIASRFGKRVSERRAPGFTDRVDQFLCGLMHIGVPVDHRPLGVKITSLIFGGVGWAFFSGRPCC